MYIALISSGSRFTIEILCTRNNLTILICWGMIAKLPGFRRVGGNRSKERDRKSELVLRSTYQIFEWDRNNSDQTFYNVVRYVHIPLVP